MRRVKCAVRHEVLGWPSGALPCRDYKKCYQFILDVVHVISDRLLEFKVVGGLCSYKVSMHFRQ